MNKLRFIPRLMTLGFATLPSVVFSAESFAPIFDRGSLLQMLLSLALIVLLIYVLALIFRRFQHGTLGPSAALKIVATLPLGTRERLLLVQLGEKQILLAVAPGSITTLQVFDKPVVDADKVPAKGDFSAILKRVTREGES